jgi:hypothetical protein
LAVLSVLAIGDVNGGKFSGYGMGFEIEKIWFLGGKKNFWV